ncbi:MAG TPA: hypothetical protein VMJ90_10575, partial [Anaerolineales bacterium]|nr:hypothetical protein [Anaerolineales bacterium]
MPAQLSLQTQGSPLMMHNPYVNVLIMAALTALFIVASCYGLGSLARTIVKARGATPKKQENAFAGYFFAAPWIVGFLIFVVVPLLFSLYWSFTDFRIGSGSPAAWKGLENYQAIIFNDDNFRA